MVTGNERVAASISETQSSLKKEAVGKYPTASNFAETIILSIHSVLNEVFDNSRFGERRNIT